MFGVSGGYLYAPSPLHTTTTTITLAGGSVTPGCEQKSQVLALVTIMQAALKTVTFIDLDVYMADCSLALPLAEACKNLKHLVIREGLHEGLLAAFGEACKGLDTLHVHSSMTQCELHRRLWGLAEGQTGSVQTIKDLDILLPAVSHLSIISKRGGQVGMSETALLWLVSCKNLISVDIQGSVPRAGSLPCAPVLQQLACWFAGDQWNNPNLVTYCNFPQLHTLVMRSTGEEHFSAKEVACFLEHAPAVKDLTFVTEGLPAMPLTLSWLRAHCDPASIPAFSYLNNRVRAGMVIKGGLNLSMSGRGDDEADDFFAECPILDSVSGFNFESLGVGLTSLQQWLAAKLPNMSSFGLKLPFPSDEVSRMSVLTQFRSLKSIALVCHVGSFSLAQLRTFLPPVRSLRSLEVYHRALPGVMQIDANRLRAALRHMVTVMISENLAVVDGVLGGEDSDVEIL